MHILFILLLIRIIMAQCNRCGAALSSTTSRALKVHHLHCPKNTRMKFKEPASQIPKSTRDVAQEPVGESEVKIIVHSTFRSTHFELIIIQKLELPPDLKMDIDVEFDPNITPQVEPEFVEGSSVRYFVSLLIYPLMNIGF